MMFDDEVRKPTVFSTKNIVLAFALHVAAFLLLWLFSVVHFKPKETIIPIELVFEAPPDEVAPDEPEPEPPKVTPKPPEPPPAVDEKVDAVVKIKEEKKPEKKKPEPPKEKPKPEPKPEKPKEPEKPKKTKEQIKKEKDEARKKRLDEMRRSAKNKPGEKPPPVVGTGEKLDPNWKKLLAQGYKPSDHTELAPNEESRCYSLIRTAFYDRWDRPPWTDTLKEMVLRVWFGPGGRVVNFRLEKGSGDAKADLTVINAAKSVRCVVGLSSDFIDSKKSSGVPIRFKVTPQ